MTKQAELPEPYNDPLGDGNTYTRGADGEYYSVGKPLFTADQMRQFREDGVREALDAVREMILNAPLHEEIGGECTYMTDECKAMSITLHGKVARFAQSQSKGES